MKGFTLIETMIAVSILALATAGPLYAASRSLIAAQNSRDRLTASYLAQEGIEYIRSIRDNDYLIAYKANSQNAHDNSWNNFRSTMSLCLASSADACTIDVTTNNGTLASCPTASTCPPLQLDSSKRYNHQSGVNSIFTRTIQVSEITATEEKIISTVSWRSRGIPFSVTITDHLTQWQ